MTDLRGSKADGRVFTPVLTERGVETVKAAAPKWLLATEAIRRPGAVPGRQPDKSIAA